MENPDIDRSAIAANILRGGCLWCPAIGCGRTLEEIRFSICPWCLRRFCPCYDATGHCALEDKEEDNP